MGVGVGMLRKVQGGVNVAPDRCHSFRRCEVDRRGRCGVLAQVDGDKLRRAVPGKVGASEARLMQRHLNLFKWLRHPQAVVVLASGAPVSL